MLVADHVQKVMKPNFAASWEEVGEENELEDTFALSTMKTLPGNGLCKEKKIQKIRDCYGSGWVVGPGLTRNVFFWKTVPK